MSDVRDWEAFVRGRWRWTSFGYEKGFPRGCQFSDIDAVVEFDGRSLYIEAKGYDGIGIIPDLNRGQMLLLKHLAEQDDVAVFVVYGCASCNDPYAARNMRTGQFHDWRGMDKEDRRKHLKRLIDESMGLA